MKTCLLNGLPSEILNDIQGYLDLTAGRKHDLHSQWEDLCISSAFEVEKASHVIQEKYVGGVETYTTDNLKHNLAYRDDNHQHRFKDES